MVRISLSYDGKLNPWTKLYLLSRCGQIDPNIESIHTNAGIGIGSILFTLQVFKKEKKKLFQNT